MIPLTGVVLAVWWKYNQRSVKKMVGEGGDLEARADTLEDPLMQRIRVKTLKTYTTY